MILTIRRRRWLRRHQHQFVDVVAVVVGLAFVVGMSFAGRVFVIWANTP